MNKIVQHFWNSIKLEQTESLAPVFGDKSVRSTGDMSTWFTSKPCYITEHSHISHCVFDSTWEATESFILEKNPNVLAWVKNDHLGFEVVYEFNGIIRKYFPDFLVKLTNGKILVLETKGQMSRQMEAKWKALKEWIAAVNGIEDYGDWCCDISFNVADIDGIVAKYATTT
jgi:type III restriction enzyme